MAVRSEARSALLVHYAPGRRAELEGMCDAVGPRIRPAVAGLTVTIGRRGGDGAGGSPDAGRLRRRGPPRAPRPPATGSRTAAASVARSAAVRQNAAASVAAPTPSAAVAAASSSGIARAASPDAARWTAIRLTSIGSAGRLEAVREPRVEDPPAAGRGGRRRRRRG